MISVLDDGLLDDPARLATADGECGGCLRAVAVAGAQVRSTVEMAAEVGVGNLAGFRPRALVLVARPGAGPAVTDLLAALLTPACPVPVVVGDTVPGWVGPLDVVLAHGDDPGDLVLAESVDRARRYGAQLVVTGPADGPVAAAAGGLLLPPRVPVPAGFAFPRALAAGLVVLDTLGLLRTDLPALADELDREAERDHGNHESFVNPAKALALRLAEHTPLLCGLDPPATAVAGHAADMLAGFAGVVAGATGYAQLATRTVLRRAAVRATSGMDIFADPDDPADAVGPRLRVLLLTVTGDGDPVDPATAALRIAAQDTLTGADLLAPDEATGGGAVTRAAVLALRFEMAAVYLGLASGALGGPGRQAPATV